MADEAWRRTVECKDGFDRERALTVSVSDGEVVVSTPPGENAKLRQHQVTALRHHLEDAQREVVRQQMGRS